jgi:hypothetical protein
MSPLPVLFLFGGGKRKKKKEKKKKKIMLDGINKKSIQVLVS